MRIDISSAMALRFWSRPRVAAFAAQCSSLAVAGVALALLGACADIADSPRARTHLARANPLASRTEDHSRAEAAAEQLFVTSAPASNSSVAVGRYDSRANVDVPGANDADRKPACVDASIGDARWTEEVVASCMTHEHQRARAQLAVSPSLPPLSWSPQLAKSAREWAAHLAQRCQGLEHPKRARYGQNLAARASIGEGPRFSPAEVVGGWVAEGRCWTPGKVGVSDRCDPACVAELNSSGCGHYTQLMWRATRELGCAYATCRREGFLDEYWVCNYSPPGNVRGRTPY